VLLAICKLEVYDPVKSKTSAPILVFVHGGGFTKGGLRWPPGTLVHANVGAFFASRGILTVVVTYRLVPGSVFPQGSEDVRSALTWVIEHLGDKGNTNRIFVLGHSAGGVHVVSLLLQPSLFVQTWTHAVAIRGVALLGVSFEIGNGPNAVEFRQASEQYYGSSKKITTNQPLGLLRRLERDYVASLPPIRIMMAEREPRRVSSSGRMFSSLFASEGGVVEDVRLEGHTHMSPILSLSSGSGEEWGEDIVRWITARY